MKIHDKIIRDITQWINQISGLDAVMSGEGHLFRLEDGDSVYYQPDIVVRKDDKIIHIIEVETSIINKSTIGGVIQADYVTKEQGINLTFVVLENPHKKPTTARIEQFKKRLGTTKDYTKRINNISVIKEDEINEENIKKIFDGETKWLI